MIDKKIENKLNKNKRKAIQTLATLERRFEQNSLSSKDKQVVEMLGSLNENQIEEILGVSKSYSKYKNTEYEKLTYSDVARVIENKKSITSALADFRGKTDKSNYHKQFLLDVDDSSFLIEKSVSSEQRALNQLLNNNNIPLADGDIYEIDGILQESTKELYNELLELGYQPHELTSALARTMNRLNITFYGSGDNEMFNYGSESVDLDTDINNQLPLNNLLKEYETTLKGLKNSKRNRSTLKEDIREEGYNKIKKFLEILR